MADTTFDLGFFTEVPLTAIETDASGNVISGGPVPVFTSSDETILTLQTQTDGSVLAVRATKNAATVVITATVTNPDGTTASGNLNLTLGAIVPPVVAVSSVEIVPGIPA